ncbi:MAG: CDP-alcohol phosphatidyltransferase family protein [Marinisporobacter sp.]|jgi:CDP-diacylglycerol--glycerol-3-phosphate 3-phosphatidyltransferase|nr:CDP-alcohol phosphatidyltransferase family protein [Marinisporobacter sp.]
MGIYSHLNAFALLLNRSGRLEEDKISIVEENMLDTYGRKYAQPLIENVSNVFIKLNMRANHITILAFLIGISSGFFIYFDYFFVSCIALWISGLLDAVDGTVARKEKDTSSWGTLMDITFDRIVEMSIVIGLAVKFPYARMQLLILTASILLSMAIFLTVGALSEKNGIKSFYYQAGIAERTEGFILFTGMILFRNYMGWITNLFTLVVGITAIQRMMEAKKLLK